MTDIKESDSPVQGEEPKQPVAEESKDQPTAEPADAGAQAEPSLDDLLREWDEAAVKPEPKQTNGKDSKPDDTTQAAMLSYVQRQREKEEKAALADMVRQIKGDHKVPDDMVEDFIHGSANRDPALVKAFNEREIKPKQFERLLKAAGKKFSERLAQLPNREATEDREAVVAAVRGASTKAPPANDDLGGVTEQDVRNMNDVEFERWKKTLAK